MVFCGRILIHLILLIIKRKIYQFEKFVREVNKFKTKILLFLLKMKNKIEKLLKNKIGYFYLVKWNIDIQNGI